MFLKMKMNIKIVEHKQELPTDCAQGQKNMLFLGTHIIWWQPLVSGKLQGPLPPQLEGPSLPGNDDNDLHDLNEYE